MKKYFKVTIEKNIVTADNDENYFDEYLVREDVYTKWVQIQQLLGWEVTCENTLQLQVDKCDEFPETFLIKEIES